MAKAAQKVANTEIVTDATNTEVTKEQVATTVDMAALNTKHAGVKSKMIRELHAGGMSTAAITKHMQTVFPKFIYQHARNVLNTQVKKAEG